jgi:hypothetical protein
MMVMITEDISDFVCNMGVMHVQLHQEAVRGISWHFFFGKALKSTAQYPNPIW